MKFIHEIPLLLITFFTVFLPVTLLSSCNGSEPENPFRTYQHMTITLDSKEEIKTYLALDDKQQTLGLSKVKSDEFKASDAMLFPTRSYQIRQFWMPETHFDLDLFFLSPDLEVLDIHRGLKHFKKREPRGEIPLSKVSYCQHVLELRADSPIAAKIKKGMKLKSSWSPERIISNIRLKR